jgi:DNA repair exonuclease SbcCD ATPase subunit
MKKVIYKTLRGRNFLSIGNDEIVIDFKEGLSLITGENIDLPERKNGIGKSAICEMFYYALFDKTIRDISKPLIVNNVTKGKGNVELEFDVIDEQGSKSYIVKRQVKPSSVELLCNGVDITKDSIKNTNDYICDLISSNAILCKSCDILSLSDNTPFMAKKPEDKRKFVNDIFSLEVFGKMLKELKGMVTENNKDISTITTQISEIANTINILERQKAEYDENIRKQKQIIENKRKEIEQDIEDTQESISKIIIEDIELLKADKEKYDTLYDKIERNITKLTGQISNQEAMMRLKRKSIDSFANVDGVECDKCLQSIPHSHIEHLEKLKEQYEKEYEDMENILNEFVKNKADLREKKSKIVRKIDEIQEKIQKQRINADKITMLTGNLDKYKKDLENLESNYTIPEFKNDIESVVNRKQQAERVLGELREKESDYEICKFILGEEGVKSFIVKRLLDMLNQSIQKYITDLGMTMRCQFDEFFEDKMTNDKGKEISYWNLSGGERRTVDLACAWAFKDIKRTISGVHSNVEFCDEIYDSAFDSKGYDLLIDATNKRISKNNLSIYAISHRKEMLKHVNGDIIHLEKENGTTRRVFKN